MRYTIPIAVLVCLLATDLLADDTAMLQQWLERRIVPVDQTRSEVQSFVESRLPPLALPGTVDDWQAYAQRIRQQVLDRVVLRGEAARWAEGATAVEWGEEIEGGAGYKIRKLRYQAVPGLWIPALLYVPDKLEEKVPVIMNVNGHDGKGKAAPYKQMRCINLAKRGMLVLNPEWLGMGQLAGDNFKHGRMNQLDLCGTSGLAPFYLAMKRGLDVLLAQPHADPERVAVAGLSGGGWQTITISSLDTRVKLCNPVAGYSSFRTRLYNFSDLGDSEQTPCDLATVADYEHLTAILSPRPALLTYNVKDDCCFAADHALPPLIDAARPVYRLFGKELSLRWHVNYHPGTHNFEIENREALYRMIGDFFYADLKSYSSQEIDCEGELKTAEQLKVELPADNENFQTLALKLAQALPQAKSAAGPAPDAWRETRRAELAKLVRYQKAAVRAETVGSEQNETLKCTVWKLALADTWSVPAVELVRGTPKGTTVLTSDEGRPATRQLVAQLLDAGQRVIVVDLFYLGECKIPQRDYLFALLVATVGERALGIQASQLAAVARWAGQGTGPVSVVASGPRTGIIARVAASIEHESIARVDLHGAAWHVADVINKNMSYEQCPELFCFGLLREFDTDQLDELRR